MPTIAAFAQAISRPLPMNGRNIAPPLVTSSAFKPAIATSAAAPNPWPKMAHSSSEPITATSNASSAVTSSSINNSVFQLADSLIHLFVTLSFHDSPPRHRQYQHPPRPRRLPPRGQTGQHSDLN